jgi:hypothetical protein
LQISDEFGEIYFIKSPIFADFCILWNRLVYLPLKFQLIRRLARGVRTRELIYQLLNLETSSITFIGFPSQLENIVKLEDAYRFS